jgi:metallo-beta-lactamase family protein
MEKLSLNFYGGVGSTTGANIMLNIESNPTSLKLRGTRKILVDCGLIQGGREAEEKNFLEFGYDPSSVDFLLITHAHMDHIGRIPKLVREGFNGRIISTEETKELANPMLHDALKVMRMRHKDREMFDEKDIDKSLSLWEGFDYDEKIDLFPDCHIKMIDAGHILGSAIINVVCGEKTIAFTGDLGNSPSPLLPDNEFPVKADYLVMESVYGDRNHETKKERREKLKTALIEGIEKGGTIVIPAFSIERTQVLLYEINNMVEDGEIAQVPVFLDSPLASKVTAIYQKYKDRFKESVRDEIKAGDDIFDFPNLKIIRDVKESAQIENTKGAKIVIAGSGMSEGGRVVGHEERYLGDPNATIILVGYQSVGSLGRRIQDKNKEININGRKIKVRATIKNILGYSSHKDSEHLLEFVERTSGISEQNDKSSLKKVFVIMGEPKSSLFLVQRIRDYLDIEAIYPEEGREYELTP